MRRLLWLLLICAPLAGCGGLPCGDGIDDIPCNDGFTEYDFAPPPEECIAYLDQQGNPVSDNDCLNPNDGVWSWGEQ